MKVGTDGVLLGAWTSLDNAKRILDVGTGTGVIALILAQRSSTSTHIDAIDILADVCEQAIENVSQSPWPQKVVVHHKSLQKYEAPAYDLIVSNPPFFNKSYKPPKEQRTLARHTDSLLHNEILLHSKRLLTSTGRLSLILPEVEGNLMIKLAINYGWHCIRTCAFRSRPEKSVERLLIEFSLQPGKEIFDELVLYREKEVWSEAYRKLTQDLYLNPK